MRILNYGSLNLDDVYQVDHMVQAGETLSTTAYAQNLGGKGLNQSIALSRAGCEVWHAGQIGGDGGALRRALTDSGVHTDFLRTVATPTGHAIIQVDAGGQNCILLYGGANRCQDTRVMAEVMGEMSPGDVLVCQNEINDMDTLTRLAWERGMRIALNPSPMDGQMTPEILRRCRWIFVNETEAAALSGLSEDDPEAMLDSLCAAYPGVHVVMTLGARGVLTGEGDMRLRGRCCRVKAVDTTAAGDTFTGYYLAGMLTHGNEQLALDTAATAAAMAVMREGASPSIPMKEDVVVGSLPWRE